MSSEYTRRSHLLNSSIQVGRHSGSRSEESYASRLPKSGGALSNYLSSRATEADATESDDYKSYDSLLRRIRAEQAESLNSTSNSSSSSYLSSSRFGYGGGGGSSGSGGVDGPTSQNGSRESFLHSRHQELMKNRRMLDAYNYNFATGGTGIGGTSAVDQQQQQQNFTNEFSPSMSEIENANACSRPTYTVRNIPVRSLDDVRETIAIRRQYYRERLFGKNDDESAGENTNQDVEGTGLTPMPLTAMTSLEGEGCSPQNANADTANSSDSNAKAENIENEVQKEYGENASADGSGSDNSAHADADAEPLQSEVEADYQKQLETTTAAVADCVQGHYVTPDESNRNEENENTGKSIDETQDTHEEQTPDSVPVSDDPSLPEPIAIADSESERKPAEQDTKPANADTVASTDEVEMLSMNAAAGDVQMSIEGLSVSCTESETVSVTCPDGREPTTQAEEPKPIVEAAASGNTEITIEEVSASHTISNTVQIEMEQTPEPESEDGHQLKAESECDFGLETDNIDVCATTTTEQKEPAAEPEISNVGNAASTEACETVIPVVHDVTHEQEQNVEAETSFERPEEMVQSVQEAQASSGNSVDQSEAVLPDDEPPSCETQAEVEAVPMDEESCRVE